MRTCPTCLGEAKVKDGVDHWVALRERARFLSGFVWRGLLVAATPVALTAFCVAATRLTLWSIGAPAMTPSDFGDHILSPAVPLYLAAFIGMVGGLVLAVMLAIEMEWDGGCTKNGWCCKKHAEENARKK